MNQTFAPDAVHARLRDSQTRRKAQKRDEDLAAVRQAFINGLDHIDAITLRFDIDQSDANGVDGLLLYEYATQVANEFNRNAEKHEYIADQYRSSYVVVTLKEKRGDITFSLFIPILLAIAAVILYVVRRKIRSSSQNK
jgi:hypothetical protein